MFATRPMEFQFLRPLALSRLVKKKKKTHRNFLSRLTFEKPSNDLPLSTKATQSLISITLGNTCRSLELVRGTRNSTSLATSNRYESCQREWVDRGRIISRIISFGAREDIAVAAAAAAALVKREKLKGLLAESW